MPPFSLADPPVLAFLVLPAAVAILFVWGTAAAWRRSGDAAFAGRAAMMAAAGALIWMGATLALAEMDLRVASPRLRLMTLTASALTCSAPF